MKPRSRTPPRSPRNVVMSDEPNPYKEGKRAGVHPLIVIFVVLIGLWLFVFLIVPSSKNKQATGTEGPTGPAIEDPEAAPVLFKVQVVVSDMNAISLTVPQEATNSQVADLLDCYKRERSAVEELSVLCSAVHRHH